MSNSINQWFSNSSYYVQKLDDPVQTHAVYGVTNSPADIQLVKDVLKSKGANRFRVVKNDFGKAIICFKYGAK